VYPLLPGSPRVVALGFVVQAIRLAAAWRHLCGCT